MTSTAIKSIMLDDQIDESIRKPINSSDDCNSFLNGYFENKGIEVVVNVNESKIEGSNVVFRETKYLHNQKIYLYQQYFGAIEVRNNCIKVIVEEDTKLPSLISSYLEKIELFNANLDDELLEENNPEERIFEDYFQTSEITGLESKQFLYFVDSNYYSNDNIVADQSHSHSEAVEFRLPEGGERLLDKHVLVIQSLIQVEKGNETSTYEVLSQKATGEILFSESLAIGVTGNFMMNVFEKDPPSEKGSMIQWTDSIHEINSYKQWQEVKDITIKENTIKNTYVEIKDLVLPKNEHFPSSIKNKLDFHIGSDQFAAINTFHHWNYMFSFIREELKLSDLFQNVNFPICIDISIEDPLAKVCSKSPHSYEVRFKKIEHESSSNNQKISLGTSNRISWHELLHIVLKESFNYAVVLFAEGTGDAVAAIMHDPGKGCRENLGYRTFPWIEANGIKDRYHNRSVANNFEFYAEKSLDPYEKEQVFSSALFRFYRCIGGDSDSEAIRTQAAKYTVYLHLKAMGYIPHFNVNIGHYISLLKNSDCGGMYDRYSGGTLRKVMRWAFRMQGAFRHTETNYLKPGDVPEVDLSLRGVKDSYEYTTDLECAYDVIKVTSDCSLSLGDNPKLTVEESNFIWITVYNIGRSVSGSVKVKLYTKLLNDQNWTKCELSDKCTSSSISSLSGKTRSIYGPFEIVPTNTGTYQIFAVAECNKDISIKYLKPNQPDDENQAAIFPLENLISFDNNMALRTMQAIKRKDSNS